MFQRDRRRRSIAVIIYLPSLLYEAIIAFIIAAALVLCTFPALTHPGDNELMSGVRWLRGGNTPSFRYSTEGIIQRLKESLVLDSGRVGSPHKHATKPLQTY